MSAVPFAFFSVDPFQGSAEPGRDTAFLVLLAFLLSFLFIRTSARMIRAQVSWWPGNVETSSGLHIHHLVWGICLMTTAGFIGFAFETPVTPWYQIAAIAFGFGAGLTFDEFALWVNLRDVYWSSQGRISLDAVVLVTAWLATGIGKLQADFDVEKSLPKNHPFTTIDKEIRSKFGGRNTIIALLVPKDGGDVWRTPVLEVVREATLKALRLDDVIAQNVVSLASPSVRYVQELNGGLDIDLLMRDPPKTPEDMAALRADWQALVNDALAEATLTRPAAQPGYVSQGKQGLHSEHLGYLLAEMQSLARAHPGATW